ncbi:MAG: TAXI family TRAP transporter solute-binding subunit [Chloroflexota bacterium]
MKYDLTEIVLALLTSLNSFVRHRLTTHLLRTVLLASAILVVVLISLAVYSWQHVTVLTAGTGRTGGPAHTIAAVLAQAVHRVDARIRIEVKETAGSIENTQLLGEKQLELGLAVTTADVGPDAGLVGLLYPQGYLLAVRRLSRPVT